MDFPFLVAVCPSLVGSLSAPKLCSPNQIGFIGYSAVPHSVKLLYQRRHGVFEAVLARPRLGCSHDPGRAVLYAGTVLGLLVVLPARADSAVKPRDLKVLGSASVIDAGGGGVPDHGDRDRRAMHPALPLGRRDALDSMTTGFRIEAGDALAFELDGEGLVSGARVRTFGRAVLSTLAKCEAGVGGGKVSHEESGIGAALGGPDLDGASFRHGRLLCGAGLPR